MKTTLTALSLMLVLGSVSAVQASPAVSHETVQHKEFTATSNAVTRPAIEGDFAANHTVNTHMGAFGVNKDSVVDKHPESATSVCKASDPGIC